MAIDWSDDEQVLEWALAEAAKLDAEAPWSTLEELLTRADLFGLRTATFAQRFICRVLDGRPIDDLLRFEPLPNVGAYPPEVRERSTWEWMMGGASAAALPSVPPLELYGVGGIRTAKSLLISAHGFDRSRRCDVSRLRHGEVARYSGLSTELDKARAILQHLVPTATSKPALAQHVVGDPTAEGLTVRHPSGAEVDIRIVAGKRAGGSVVSYWSAGAAFDEAPRMVGAAEGVVNFDEARAAVLGRLLPGAQLLAMGSPWAPMGPIYQAVVDYHGKPSTQLVVLRATAPMLNWHTWTPAEVERVLAQPGGDQTYQADILGEFVDAETGLVSHGAIERATRRTEGDLERNPLASYLAVMDPATRRNAWTLVVLTRLGTGRIAVACARQWQGTPGAPLSVDATLDDVAAVLGRYGVDSALTDQWAADAIKEAAHRKGLYLFEEPWTGTDRTQKFLDLAQLIETGGLELSRDAYVAADLRRVRRKVMQSGGVQILLPQTADGRHCDYAPALAMGVSRWLAPVTAPDKAPSHDEVEAEYKSKLRDEARRRNDTEWDHASTWAEDLVS